MGSSVLSQMKGRHDSDIVRGQKTNEHQNTYITQSGIVLGFLGDFAYACSSPIRDDLENA